MKRLLALVAGGLGLGALLRRRRYHPAAELGPSPADDLRAKLAETRNAASEEEPATDEPESPTADVDDRRRSVHDRARDAIDELG